MADQRDPIWIYSLGKVDAVPDRIELVGRMVGATFVPNEALLPSHEPAAAAPRPFPLSTNLLAQMSVRPFGVEERASATTARGRTTISCAAGSRPAGVVLANAGLRFPRAMTGTLEIEGVGENVAFAMVEAGRDAETTFPSRSAETKSAGARLAGAKLAAIPSAAWPGSGKAELVVVCPAEAAAVSISAIRIVPHPIRQSRGIGTWLWDLTPWLDRPELLVAAARTSGVRDLFLQLGVNDAGVVAPARVRNLMATLAAAGIAPHAVEGDPDMASAAGRANALRRAAVLRQFKRAGAPVRSFQYDIEPYLQQTYRSDPASGWREWAVTVQELSGVLGENVAVVVPFWMLDEPSGKTALRQVKSAVSSITVMAYRTDVEVVEQIAVGWLDWGSEMGIPIDIALESGPLPEEIHRIYNRSASGELVLDRSGRQVEAILLSTIVADSYAKPVYSFNHEFRVEPSRISFLGNRDAIDAALARLEGHLGAWATFGGMLVHDLITPGG
ncbi:hypothetical protein [Aminobacter sp. MET-1]|uniref:hypothetical protein n=1 Tax=Aminobacter sp. MET-1 TaxID=2951085 RepID=UPI00226A5431|nr:hypothetical protein [Aminobacter sp. MET-1]MCX8568367.1 hypothetical protein [Aminobacter sp. MET-1]